MHVFDNYEFGYRTNFDLCSGGLIEVTSSVSAAEYDVVFYRIGTDGASPVVEDVFRCVGTQTGNDTVSFQYTENGKEITEEEYNRKIEDYAKPLEGLEWKGKFTREKKHSWLYRRENPYVLWLRYSYIRIFGRIGECICQQEITK